MKNMMLFFMVAHGLTSKYKRSLLLGEFTVFGKNVISNTYYRYLNIWKGKNGPQNQAADNSVYFIMLFILQ
jgi:hypothetical protein